MIFRTPDTVIWYENIDGNGTFAPPHLISDVEQLPRTAQAGDLDGDGDADVVTAGGTEDKVSWYENLDGFGNFAPRQVIAFDIAGPSSFAHHLVDVDGDQDLDILTASYFGARIAWYENTDGAGSFSPARIARVGSDNGGQAFPADIDGDGDMDVLFLVDTTGEIAWVENQDGAGTFGPDQPIDIPLGGSPLNLIGDDLDGDGDIDAVVATQTALLWYENTDGAGTFGPSRTISADHAAFIDTADIDGNTDIDMIQSQLDTSTLAWHRNDNEDCNANGVVDSCDLSTPTSSDCNANSIPDECDTIAGDDCNTNNVPDSCDIATSNSPDCTANGIPDECEPDCNNNGVADSCDIQATTSTDCDTNGIPDECEPDCNGNSVADACDIQATTSDDCTGNHVPDECENDCNGNGTADICELDLGTANDCDGNGQLDACDLTGGSPDCDTNGVPDPCDIEVEFVERILSADSGHVLAADIDGDGDPDAVTRSGPIGWYENTDGNGSFGLRQVVDAGVSGDVFATDIDGDGDTDLVTASGFSYDNIDGLGTFGPAQVASGTFGTRYLVDLNGDGYPDLLGVFFDLELQVAWHPNDGAGTFGALQFITNRLVDGVGVCDVNDDGYPDLIQFGLNELFEREFLWRENLAGSGAFGPEQQIVFEVVEPSSVRCADVDNDGDNDLQAGLGWYENLDGQGTFGALRVIDRVSLGSGGGLRTADLDGDGDLDILGTGEDAAAWWERLDEQGTFAFARFLSFNGIPREPSPADVDGDGDIDFLWGQASWYENLSNDCNGNAVPDLCESDCNLNGAEDSCEIAARPFEDCDDSQVLDQCEAGCSDPLLCNTDGDVCIDFGDCAPSDPTVWAEPEPLRSLRISKPSPIAAFLSWGNSPSPGADSVTYSQLRSTDPADFLGAATCFGIGDGTIPPAGTAFYYVVRIKNGCPGSDGTIGTNSDGVPRPGLTCP